MFGDVSKKGTFVRIERYYYLLQHVLHDIGSRHNDSGASVTPHGFNGYQQQNREEVLGWTRHQAPRCIQLSVRVRKQCYKCRCEQEVDGNEACGL